MSKFILPFEHVSKRDVELVGGKNASLGEMMQKTKVPIPPGFAVTAKAYWHFLEITKIKEKISENIRKLDVGSVQDLKKRGKKIRTMIKRAQLPDDLQKEIIHAYAQLGKKLGRRDPLVAVRSSATAEDLAEASFAGQQETYLNVRGEQELLTAVKKCIASLFTNRAIHYREDHGFDHMSVALSVGVQAMVQPSAAGVAFTLDPDSGFDRVVCIEGGWGIGEAIVKGIITPDVFFVFKPTLGIISKELGDKRIKIVKSRVGNVKQKTTRKERAAFCLSDDEVKQLAKYCIQIEQHYNYPQDIEWAKDEQGRLFILQARPETVHALRKKAVLEQWVLKERSKVLITGDAIGRKIGKGKVNVIRSVKELGKFKSGQVLVTEMTDPDWEPIMKIASAIVTDRGGRTSHCAIVSRELGVPAIIGTRKATTVLKSGQPVTVDCTQADGKVWEGELDYEIKKLALANIPKTKTKVFINIGVPEKAFSLADLPVDGVGLAREEFIITSHIGEHPLEMIAKGRGNEFIDKLAAGIAKIACAFYPKPVVVRLSDFKTNEYASLAGGKKYEFEEANALIGWRGASRYTDPEFEPAFRLECKAFKKAREEMGLTNIIPMIPFCRTVEEGKRTLQIMASEGLEIGKKGLEIWVMAEIPSNVILADEFARLGFNFSVGSNDLTMLCLGIDRDNAKLAKIFDERNPAVLRMLEHLIKTAHKYGRKVSICGDAPSTYKDYAEFLVKLGIDSISVTPDVAVDTKLRVAEIEKRLRR